MKLNKVSKCHIVVDANSLEMIDTIVPCGVMGSGKSSLACMFALKDNQSNISSNPDQQPFPVGAGEKAMTTSVQMGLTGHTEITSSNVFRIIDSPGLDQDEEEDITHIKELIQTIKDNTNFVKMFPIVING